MGVAVVIPWAAPEGDSRWPGFLWLVKSWAAQGVTPVIALADDDQPWSKSRVILQVAQRLDADTLVINDADSWCPGVPAAVRAVERGAPWAVPHLRVHRLTADSTKLVLDTGAPLTTLLPTVRRPYRGIAAGGIVVVPRQTILDVPPDPRFTGWGSEDGAWRDALRCLAGMEWRDTRQPLYHLHHQPAPRTPQGTTSPENAALAARYRAARRDPEAMRALIAEHRAVTA